MNKKLYFSLVFILIVISILPFILKIKTKATFPQNTYCNVQFKRPIYEFKDSLGNSVFVLDENGNLYLNGTKVLSDQNTIPQPKTGFGLKVNSNFYWAFNNSNVNIHGKILQKQTLPIVAGQNDIIFRNPISKESLAFFDGTTGNLEIKGLVIYNGYYSGMPVNDNAFNSNCTTEDNYNSSTGTDYWQDYYCDRANCVYRNIDLDNSQQLCEGGNLNWDIGGNIDPTTCCGDDSSEYNLTRKCNSGCTSDSSDDACCDNSNDAVYNSNCYPETSSMCSPWDNNKIASINNNHWSFVEDCSTHCIDSCAKYNTCSNGNCIGETDALLGQNCTEDVGFVTGLCNNNYACSNATGNMFYNNGGPLNCTATCGGSGHCDHATNCVDCSKSGSINGCACACGGYGIKENTSNGNCNDGIDNDCDGSTDYSDSDCPYGDGHSCQNDGECASQHCVDGVCCNEACDSACESCNQQGNEGTCTALPSGTYDSLCNPCNLCDGTRGSCNQQAPNNHWGDNLYGCEGTNARCYSGSCVTCGGWLYDDGCSGCAGQGSKACWYRGADDESCTTTCTNHDGCTPANWDDSTACNVCAHFVPSYTSCGSSAETGSPKIWNDQECTYRGSASQVCGDSGSGARTRFCVCNS